MFKKFLLLISACCASTALADTFDPNFSYSGFVYHTHFSDKNFQDSRSVVAINGSVDFNNFAVRAQLSTTNTPIQRFVFEASAPIGEKTEIIAQIGRFGRTDPFNHTILDSPASSQVAMLPLAGYSYRMFNGSFTLMDGQQVRVVSRITPTNLLIVRAAYGKMVTDNQEDLQKEAFKRYSPEFEFDAPNKSYDLGIHYEIKNWQFFVSQNHYVATLKTTQPSRFNSAVAAMFENTEYTLKKLGIRYNSNNYVARVELNDGKTRTYSSKGIKTSELDARDYSLLFGKYCGNHLIYVGKSLGINDTTKTRNVDNLVGVTYNRSSRWTVSIERHKGEGRGWMKYDLPENKKSEWNSWVITTTYRF